MTLLLQIGIANVAVGALLAGAAFVVGKLCRRPALVHSLWLLVLLKLITPPLFWLPINCPASEKSEIRSSKLETNSNVQTSKSQTSEPTVSDIGDSGLGFVSDFELQISDFMAGPQPWLPVAFWVWVGGAAVWFVWAGVHLVRFQRLLRFARPAPEEVQAEADRLAAQMGLSRGPAVWLLPGALPPMVWSGAGKARLFFPEALLAKLTGEERATLLAHELAHVCRRDHWVRALELVVMGLYWWCPLVWWARRHLQASEEECCDAWVVGELPARSYASAILRTLDFLAERRPAPLGASGLSPRVRQLKTRLTHIMQNRTPKRLSSVGQAAVVVLGTLLLPLLPTLVFSQPARPRAEPEQPAEVSAIPKTDSPPAPPPVEKQSVRFAILARDSLRRPPRIDSEAEAPPRLAPVPAPPQGRVPVRVRILNGGEVQDRIILTEPADAYTLRVVQKAPIPPGQEVYWMTLPNDNETPRRVAVYGVKPAPTPAPVLPPQRLGTGNPPAR